MICCMVIYVKLCSKIFLRVWEKEKAQALGLHLLRKRERGPSVLAKHFVRDVTFDRDSMGIVARKMRDRRA